MATRLSPEAASNNPDAVQFIERLDDQATPCREIIMMIKQSTHQKALHSLPLAGNTFAIRVVIILIAVFASACAPGSGKDDHARINVIPLPADVKTGAGNFTLTAETVLAVNSSADAEIQSVAFIWADAVRGATGFPLPVVDLATDQEQENTISLLLDDRASDVREGYHLSVTTRSISLTSPTANGLYYGLQTLRQLLPPQIEQKRGAPDDASWTVPVVEINDKPRFRYRGMHLDVGSGLANRDQEVPPTD